GIAVVGADQTIDTCTVTHAGQDGIVLEDLAHCTFDTVSNCKIIEAQNHGVVALAANLVLSKCKILSPVANGVLDLGCTDAEFASCSVSKSGSDAIGTSSLSSGGSIHDCKLTTPGFDGLLIQGDSMTVDHNTVSHSLGDGIGVSCSNSTFTGNTVSASTNDGFVLTGDHNTLSGNKAHGSGAFDLDDQVGDPSNVVDDTNKFGTTGPGGRRLTAGRRAASASTRPGSRAARGAACASPRP